MSTEVFDLSAWYRDEVPRRELYLSPRIRWETTNLDPLAITATGASPSEVFFIKELRIRDQAFTPNESVAGDGLIDIIYPNEAYDDVITKTINYMEELAELSKEILTDNSQSIYVIVFDPVIKLFTTQTENTFTVQKNTASWTITSGELDITAKGWKMVESNY